MSTKKSFIERSVQFEEESMPTIEIGESSSPLPPLIVIEDSNKFFYSDMYNNLVLISYTNTPTIPKWAENTIQAAGELTRNPSDPRRTRSQFESALSVKDPCFCDKCFIMVEYDKNTYEY